MYIVHEFNSYTQQQNTLLYVKCTYLILIGRFLVTGPSVMLHTDPKYHIDQAIFPNIVLSSWCYYCNFVILYYCDVILYYCDIILYSCLIEMSLWCYQVQAENGPPFICL